MLKARAEEKFLQEKFEEQKRQPVKVKVLLDDETGQIQIEFSKKILVPSYMIELVNDEDSEEKRQLETDDIQEFNIQSIKNMDSYTAFAYLKAIVSNAEV